MYEKTRVQGGYAQTNVFLSKNTNVYVVENTNVYVLENTNVSKNQFKAQMHTRMYMH